MKKTATYVLLFGVQVFLVFCFIIYCNNTKSYVKKGIVYYDINSTKMAKSVGLLFKSDISTINIVKSEPEVKDNEEIILSSVEDNVAIEEEVLVNTMPEEPVVSESEYLVSIDVSKYSNNEVNGFTVTDNNKSYSLSDDEILFLTAIVASEAEKSIDDALAVVSVILNRCESSRWSSYGGPIEQTKAKGQFSVYSGGQYLSYMPGGRAYGNPHYNDSKTAVLDSLNGIRNNTYLGFNAWYNTNYSDNFIIEGGNRYK